MSDNQNKPVAENFLQFIENQEIIDFASYTGDWIDSPEELKIVFVQLPNQASGKLVYDYDKDVEVTISEDIGNISKEKSYSITDIEYIARQYQNNDDDGQIMAAREAIFEYYIVDTDNNRSGTKTVFINPSNEQETDASTQLIGDGYDNILIAPPYEAKYIWGAGGNDILYGNMGENIFVIDHVDIKFNKTTTIIKNLNILEDKIDLSHLSCVRSIDDINVDSKSNNTQITFKDSKLYMQEILLEKMIPATLLENNNKIFIFNSNKKDVNSKCGNDNSIVEKILANKYSLVAGGCVGGMIAMKIISCIFGKFEKTTEVMYMPDGSVATNTYRSQTSFNDNVPIGITFEEGREIELISLKDSNTYFKYNEVASKTSWVSKSDGILFYDYDKTMSADHKKIVMTEWSKNAKTDFEAVLEVFDTNQDMIFDSKDDKFSDFYVWQDKNSNGAVEEGELKSLKEHGINSINFNESRVSNEEQQEQGILNIATVIWEDGKITNAYDLVFITEEVII